MPSLIASRLNGLARVKRSDNLAAGAIQWVREDHPVERAGRQAGARGWGGRGRMDLVKVGGI